MGFGPVTGSGNVVAADESDCDRVCVGAGDVADGPGSVAVVLGVVAGVNGVVDGGVGGIEDDVAFDAAGAKTTGAGDEGVPVSRPVLTAGGSDVELVRDADDPHRRVRPQGLVAASRCEL